MPLTEDQKTQLGEVIGAPKKVEKERRTVRVDLQALTVYPDKGGARIGAVVHYVRDGGARTPSGGRYEAHRLTVRLRDDSRRWVGQIRNSEMQSKRARKTVILRPLESGK